eukprot:TRINITY_DN41069_c0_g1_i1.p1 TRINITY_DN41069_c0_g1~~TRINITY_DN41069_c0_g1_i1.p1  ORF type:complete len:369 (+),score=58.22 TRINITY_DN41069_c0_g1_i1:62-1108(+)
MAGEENMSDLFRQYQDEYTTARMQAGRAVQRLVEGKYKLIAQGHNVWVIRTSAGTQGSEAGRCEPGDVRRVVGRDGDWLQLGGREWVRAALPGGRWLPVELQVKGGDRDDVLEGAQKEISCAEAALSSMDRELSSCSRETRATMKQRISTYKTELQSLRRDLESTRPLQAECDRQALLSAQEDTASIDDPAGTDARARLMDTRDLLTSQARNLSRHTDRIIQMTEETRQTGQHSLEELRRQRDVIDRAQGNVTETNTELSRARAAIGRIHRRVVKNKLMLWGIITLLVCMILMIIYFSLRGKSDPSAPPAVAPPPVHALPTPSPWETGSPTPAPPPGTPHPPTAEPSP